MKFFNHKLFFKVYLVFIIFFNLILEFKGHESLTTIDYFDYSFRVIALLAIYAYSFNKKILFTKFWQAYLFFIIIWDVFVIFHDFDFSYINEPIELSLFLLLFFSIQLPTYIAIYLYGHLDVSQTIRKRTQLLLSVLLTILISNAFIYKLAYDKVSDKIFITHLKLDAMTLKMYDQNNTTYLKLMLPSSIMGLSYHASQTDDLEKYLPICNIFDEELFEIVNRYEKDNNEKYETQPNKKTAEFLQMTKKGQDKIKKLCSAKTTDEK